MEFWIEELLPDFILKDRTGYALAKAIEAALRRLVEGAQLGVRILSSVEDMPEWRLDELAWETDFPFDYGESVSVKRKWIKQALSYIPNMGTPSAVEQVLRGLFDYATVVEDIFGQIQVHVNGVYNSDVKNKVKWIIEQAQPVRNSMGSINPAGLGNICLKLQPSMVMKAYSPWCGEAICGMETAFGG